ncbi:MAG: thioredoxin family protein [Thermoanaerobaculia bacterium]
MVSLTAALLSLFVGAQIPGTGPAWETNWKRAFERAQAERKLVFVDFWASWCQPCLEMDRKTFPDPRVLQQLSDFVLLKVDVDRSAVARAHAVSVFPTYSLFDPWEKERFRFSGFHAPEPFAEKLDLARQVAPAMLRAASSLHEKQSSQGFLLLGQAYLKARAPSDARDAFQRARKLAAKDGDAALAQTAEMNVAIAWSLEGKAEKALKILEKLASKPASADCEAGVWIAIGHTRRRMKDTAAAAEAYRRALAACPANSPLRRDAEASLASLNP